MDMMRHRIKIPACPPSISPTHLFFICIRQLSTNLQCVLTSSLDGGTADSFLSPSFAGGFPDVTLSCHFSEADELCL